MPPLRRRLARSLPAAALGALATLGAFAPAARAQAQPTDELSATTIVYARGGALYRSDARGKGEAQLVALPPRTTVRALRTDASAAVLLADLGGKWYWMPLDATKPLTELPCADGPAQLATDGACVLCRNARQPGQSIIVNLRTGVQTPIAVPSPGARLVGAGADRRLVWADQAIWSAPPGNPAKKAQVAPEAPLRGLLPSPDGARAVGVYADVPIAGTPGAKAKPAELLMGFALDGVGARRKGIRAGVAVEWSHDSQWVLVQDGGSACIMRAIGGQYKCWRGFTAASIAPDGSYALVLGAPPKETKGKAAPPPKKGAPAKPEPPKPAPKPEGDPDQLEDTEGAGGAAADAASVDDVAVPPPTGPLALYRAKLDGPYTETPALLVKLVDGAAVWIPKQ